MSKKWVLGIATIMVAIGVGGMAFATFSSSVTINGSATAGTLTLNFDGSYSSSSTPSGAVCTISETPTVATITATTLQPGQYCTFNLEVKDVGTLPATSEKSAITPLSGSECTSGGQIDCIWVQDGIGLNTETGAGGSDSTNIAAGGTYAYTMYTTLPAGSTIQTTTFSFSVSLTGFVGS
jgi:hypothetical protein